MGLATQGTDGRTGATGGQGTDARTGATGGQGTDGRARAKLSSSTNLAVRFFAEEPRHGRASEPLKVFFET